MLCKFIDVKLSSEKKFWKELYIPLPQKYDIPKKTQIVSVLYNRFINEDQVSGVLSGSTGFYGIADIEGSAFKHFFIHPDGFIYNTSLDKHAMDIIQRCDDLKEMLKISKLTKQGKIDLRKELKSLQKEKAQIKIDKIFYYQVDYPEYYWETTVEAVINKHHYRIHRTPDRHYLIYKDQQMMPLYEVTAQGRLLPELFWTKGEYDQVQQLLNTLQQQKLELYLLEKQYGVLQLPALLKAVRKGSYIGDMDKLMAIVDARLMKHDSLQDSTAGGIPGEDNAYFGQLYREMKYMLLAAVGKYAEAKAILQKAKQTTHHLFDDALLDFYMGNYESALAAFKGLLAQNNSTIQLPVLLNVIKLCLLLNRKDEAREILQEQYRTILSPSPRAFPVLYSQVYKYEKIQNVLDYHVYAPEELQQDVLIENNLEELLHFFDTQYTVPEMYYNRERGLRNFYIALFGKNLKSAGDLERLKADYVYNGRFGLHQLLCDFLRIIKYEGKIVDKSLE